MPQGFSCSAISAPATHKFSSLATQQMWKISAFVLCFSPFVLRRITCNETTSPFLIFLSVSKQQPCSLTFRVRALHT